MADTARSGTEEVLENGGGSTGPAPVTDGEESTASAAVPARKKTRRKMSAASEQLSLREKMFLTMNEPSYNVWSVLYALFMTCAITITVVVIILQSYYSLGSTEPAKTKLFICDAVVTGIFTVDYFLRLVLAKYRLQFIIAPLNIIDFLSILPFFIEFAFDSAGTAISILRILRVIRILRIMSIGKASRTVREFGMALGRAFSSIVLLSVIIVGLLFLFGTLMFYVDTSFCSLDRETWTWIYTSGPDVGEPSPFQNVPISMWWAMVTVTTVGYGDFFPVTWGGKIVAVITMLWAIVVVAFPVTILGAAFSDSYDEIAAEAEEEAPHESLAVRASRFLRACIGQKPANSEGGLTFEETIEKFDAKTRDREQKKFRLDHEEALAKDPDMWFEALRDAYTELHKELRDIEHAEERVKSLRTRVTLLQTIASRKGS